MSFTEALAEIESGPIKAGNEWERGVEHEEPKDGGKDDDAVIRDARSERATLLNVSKGEAAKMVRKRWDRGESYYRQKMAQMKVNYLRYSGEPFIQVHPRNPEEIFLPQGMKSTAPPTINKLKRAVHRYQAQVTADEPILEGVPEASTDKARDQAEAATHVLRGEWSRMSLNRELGRVVQTGAIFRSGFWFFEWDERAAGKVPAQKFFPIQETGERELKFVDSEGNPVDDPLEAAQIWQGDITLKTLNPMNVRWTGGRYAHQAREAMVGFMVPLVDLYDSFPEAKKAKVRELVTGAPRDGQRWLEDLRGEENQRQSWSSDEETFDVYGDDLDADSGVLDTNAFVMHYFHKRSRQYPDGVHIITAGKFTIFRGPLRYGLIPLAHFKFLDEMNDPLGLSLIDLLKDPQELLDFTNGQILRFLQMMKRRYLVPMGSVVTERDINSPTRSFIRYNPAAGKPEAEQVPNIPNSMVDWTDRFNSQFDDEAGIHATMQGKHVPGVSSGRHAEALRQGDETVLGLTRHQIQEGLEHAGKIIVRMVRKEWDLERRVRYFDNREYVEMAFSGLDLGTTSNVSLKKGTLLMLTPAQKTETLYGLSQMGMIPPDELMRLAPLYDAAGASLTQDAHYKHARRQNEKFLAGPPDQLMEAREKYEAVQEEAAAVLEQVNMIAQRAPDMAMQIQPQIDMQLQEAEMAWQAAVMQYGFKRRGWENDMMVAMIHSKEHLRVLADDRVRGMESWWVDLFEMHAMEDYMAAHPPMPADPGSAPPAPGGPPATEVVDGSAPPPPQPI